MRKILAVIALASMAWAGNAIAANAAALQEKKSEGASYTATVKIDDV